MDDLSWCLKQKKGIKLIEPNREIAKKYILDAQRDFTLVDKKEPKWNIIKEYYVCYNSFYALLVRCGIKCEIHDCTIKLMPLFGFEEKFMEGLMDLKKERLGVQYYLGDSKGDFFDFAKEFLEFCESKLIELNDFQIEKIRKEIKKYGY